MTTVIRIQYIDGNGLWRANNICGETIIHNHSQYDEIRKRHNDVNKYPNWSNDDELNPLLKTLTDPFKYRFAFLSLDQLKQALTKEEIKEAIEVLGFQVLLLEVTDYYASKYQAIFNPESIVSEKDISSLFL